MKLPIEQLRQRSPIIIDLYLYIIMLIVRQDILVVDDLLIIVTTKIYIYIDDYRGLDPSLVK